MSGITNRRAALRVVLIYSLFGVAWILLSDTLVKLLVADHDLRYTISVFKGWFYVAFTALLLFLLIRHELKLLEAAEHSRRAAEELLQEVIDRTPCIIYIFDRQGRLVLANRTMAALVGRKPEELTGLTREEMGLSAEAAEQHRRHDDRVLAEEAPITFEEFNDGTDGRHAYLTTKFSIRNETAVCGISLDITKQVRQEDALRNARVAAEVAAQAKTIFLHTMSHELRTPLNGIMGAAELLSGEQLSPAGREYLDMARHCARSLTGMIADILDMADIESNALTLADEPLHLPELLDSLEQLYRYGADRKGLTLSFAIDGAVPESVLADRTRLGQVLASLLSNACKFSERGAVVVTVAYDRQPEGGILLFTVQDEGIGIPEEQQAGIFELFTQADGSNTRVHGGTGLGLALCKRLVELMGGRIWLESVPGEGTTVRFTLPVRQDKA